MKIFSAAFSVLLFFSGLLYGQVPEGYVIQYQQYFNDSKSLADFTFTNPSAWGIFKTNGNYFMQCPKQDSASIIPANLAVLKNKIFGDFILEADIKPVADSSGYYELGIFLGYRDSSTYYFVQLASQCDRNQYGIFLIKKGCCSRLTECTANAPIALNDHKWHKIRLERNITKRTIRLFLDNTSEPMLQVKDYEIVMGSVGFGTVASSAGFDNIKIWSQTFQEEWYK
jgi:hypothetical protein